MNTTVAALSMIALWLALSILAVSGVTSFIMWDPQWFWESNIGWRVLLVMMLLGGTSR